MELWSLSESRAKITKRIEGFSPWSVVCRISRHASIWYKRDYPRISVSPNPFSSFLSSLHPVVKGIRRGFCGGLRKQASSVERAKRVGRTFNAGFGRVEDENCGNWRTTLMPYIIFSRFSFIHFLTPVSRLNSMERGWTFCYRRGSFPPVEKRNSLLRPMVSRQLPEWLLNWTFWQWRALVFMRKFAHFGAGIRVSLCSECSLYRWLKFLESVI